MTFLHLDHDKDYRCLAAFPPSLFEGCTLHMVRMDPHGAVTTEIIRNPGGPGKSQWDLWLLVSKCHMRVLNKPPGATAPKAVREVEAAGWEVHLEAVAGPERVFAPGTLPDAIGVTKRQAIHSVSETALVDPQCSACTHFPIQTRRLGDGSQDLWRSETYRTTILSPMRTSRHGWASWRTCSLEGLNQGLT